MKKHIQIPITQLTKFTDKVHKRGKDLEKRVQQYLESMGIIYKHTTNNGIDFIINGTIHMDCIAQGVSGSIGDKLPHKCWKYIRKYKLDDIYILHPYAPIERQVGEHLEELELQYNCKIHILDWNDFTYLMNGGKFTTRNPYTYSRDNKGVSNVAPTNSKLLQFFNFQK